MSAPDLTVTVEPTVGKKLYYQAMAPSFNGGTARTKIIVRLRIKNNEGKKVRVTAIAFHFPGTNRDAIPMKAETKALVPDDLPSGQTAIDNNGWINSGITATWSNGTVNLSEDEDPEQAFNQVYLTGSVPPQISIHIKCEDFSTVVKKDSTWCALKIRRLKARFYFPSASQI